MKKIANEAGNMMGIFDHSKFDRVDISSDLLKMPYIVPEDDTEEFDPLAPIED